MAAYQTHWKERTCPLNLSHFATSSFSASITPIRASIVLRPGSVLSILRRSILGGAREGMSSGGISSFSPKVIPSALPVRAIHIPLILSVETMWITRPKRLMSQPGDRSRHVYMSALCGLGTRCLRRIWCSFMPRLWSASTLTDIVSSSRK